MPDPTTPQDEPKAARKSTAAPDPAPADPTTSAPSDDAIRYEPYPGDTFFHGGRHSPILVAMASRLQAEGCTDGRHLGPDWTNAHRDAFSNWQRQLRPKGSGDVTGIPDETAWDKLQVPRVSPLPQES